MTTDERDNSRKGHYQGAFLETSCCIDDTLLIKSLLLCSLSPLKKETKN